jgi:hypothetical protein
MKKLISKLNLTELTVAYGMSKFIISMHPHFISDAHLQLRQGKLPKAPRKGSLRLK